MVNPKKISEEGRALTCDEYDENLDILQNRANHVGFQSCATLNDLDVCLAANSVITGIQGDIDSNTDRIVTIENDLDASGSIALSLQNIEATLSADIAQNAADIEDIQDKIADELEININANTSNLDTLTQTVTNNFNGANSRLNSLDGGVNPSTGRMTIAEGRINTNQTSINNLNNTTIPGVTQARINGDKNLDNRIDQVIIDYEEEDGRLKDLIDDEVQDRIQDVNTVDNKYEIITDDLRRDLDNEIDDREDADTLLQAQINALNAGLSGAIPTGTVLPYLGITAPAGFLMCTGGSYNRNTYSALFSIISTRYGSSNSSTFNVPDFRERIPYGAISTNLNSNPTYFSSNLTTIPLNALPRHAHPSGVGNHTHTVNIEHRHGLRILPHTHGIDNLPPHSHSLFPFRNVALGGGGEDNTGAELTAVPSDDPDDPNVYFRTANLEANTIAGPAVHAANVPIYPINSPTGPNVNVTDNVEGSATRTTSSAGGSGNTDFTGNGGNFDRRQASIYVNYIIKT